MKPEDKAVVQQARKYLVPGAIVPVDVPTTQLLLRVLRQLLEQPAPVQEPVGEVSGHDWSTGLLYRDLEPGTPLYTTPPAQPEPVFCEYCGGNDDADFGLPTDHCTDCDRPDPAPPATEDSSEVDHADELTIAYLDGVHTGKRLVKREWVGLTDEERLQIMDGNTHFNMLVLAEAKLREKNGGAA
jgi:hypothetical protein